MTDTAAAPDAAAHSYDPAKNSLLELFMVSFTLGSSIVMLSTATMIYPKYYPLSVYLVFLIGYFVLEYVNTHNYQSVSKISSRSFLIYGNKGNFEFWCCQLLTICEFIINLKKVKLSIILSPWFVVSVRAIGLGMIIIGLFIRSLAMKTCGESFSHIINTSNHDPTHHQPTQVLITHGIYSHLRHPSYFGFWFFSIGIQIWLINPFNLIISLLILQYFFSIRIQVEEYFLIHNIFGLDYIHYKDKVKIRIPFVKDPIINYP